MKRKRENESQEEYPRTPGGSDSEGDESQSQEEEAETQGFRFTRAYNQAESPLSPSGSQEGFQFEPPLGSQMEMDDILIVQRVVDTQAGFFQPILQQFKMDFAPLFESGSGIAIDQQAMNDVLGKTPGFEPVPISSPPSFSRMDEEEEEIVYGSPGASQENISEAVVEKGEVVGKEKEKEKEKDVGPVKIPQPMQEAEVPEVAEVELIGEFSDEEGDEDTIYIGQAAQQIVEEASGEFLGEVVTEIIREFEGEPPEPQVVRWLILDSPEFGRLLSEAKSAATVQISMTIEGLLAEGMIES